MENHSTPHSASDKELEKHYRTNLKEGLSSKQVQERLAQVGPNQLPEKKRKGYVQNFFLQFTNPLIYLLFVAAALMFFMGKTTDPFVVLAVVVINAIMGVVQEGRAEKSLDALRKLSKIHTRVVRDAKQTQIESSLLVPGDLLHLYAGDAVPADAKVLEGIHLQVIESALTGESQSIAKIEGVLDQETILAERKNMLYAGTYIAAGRCLALVTATGVFTELGKIAALAESSKPMKTPIEKRIDKFGKQLSIVAGVVFFLLLGVGFLRGLPFAEMFMAAVSQVVSLIPEGLPAAITIALAVGVQRMSSQGAIIRRLVAVETLGSTTVICSDKTGTLTRGEMVVSEVFLPGQPIITVEGVGYSPKGRFLQSGAVIEPHDNNALLILIEAGVLCNDSKLQQEGNEWHCIGDPTEGALLTLARKAEIDDAAILKDFPRIQEIPFDSGNKMMATAHENVVMIKGAIEALLELCSTVLIEDEEQEMTSKMRQEIEREAALSAQEGRRVLSFARVDGELNKDQSFSQFKGRGLFLGFVAQIDPPREEAIKAVGMCLKAGIRPVMVTGDHILTAQAIAKQLGILQPGQEVMEGKQLDGISNQELVARVEKIAVFARLHPAQKLRIVEALQTRDEVVAMTGDGVNDAPALARADVGVAMGITGTDVAKEAAKMVVTDDNFATIVKAVEQGRLVYNNIKKVILYLLATNCAAALTMLLGVSLGYQLPMAAVQILWINVVTEGTVTINLILDPPEGDEMQHPPVQKNDKILCGHNLFRISYLIPTIALLLLITFIFNVHQGESLELAQTQTFTLLAFCAWFKVLSFRSDSKSSLNFGFLKNRYLTIGLGLSILLQAAVVYIPQLNEIFHTTPLSIVQLIMLLCLGSIVLWMEELRKWMWRKKQAG